mmetsp:Transcript_10016/g.34051  ORF Transcript_10016/g.34051 Transcript_10016/m.34051 type:complete len:603 (-) Transcript_10016:428-2236(-)
MPRMLKNLSTAPVLPEPAKSTMSVFSRALTLAAMTRRASSRRAVLARPVADVVVCVLPYSGSTCSLTKVSTVWTARPDAVQSAYTSGFGPNGPRTGWSCPTTSSRQDSVAASCMVLGALVAIVRANGEMRRLRAKAELRAKQSPSPCSRRYHRARVPVATRTAPAPWPHADKQRRIGSHSERRGRSSAACCDARRCCGSFAAASLELHLDGDNGHGVQPHAAPHHGLSLAPPIPPACVHVLGPLQRPPPELLGLHARPVLVGRQAHARAAPRRAQRGEERRHVHVHGARQLRVLAKRKRMSQAQQHALAHGGRLRLARRRGPGSRGLGPHAQRDELHLHRQLPCERPRERVARSALLEGGGGVRTAEGHHGRMQELVHAAAHGARVPGVAQVQAHGAAHHNAVPVADNGAGRVLRIRGMHCLVEWLTDAAAIVHKKAAMHEHVEVAVTHTPHALRAVREHGQLQIRGLVGHPGRGGHGIEVSRHGLGHDQVPRRAFVAHALLELATVGVRVEHLLRGKLGREREDHLTADPVVDRHGPHSPLHLNVRGPARQAQRLIRPGREGLAHLRHHVAAHHLDGRAHARGGWGLQLLRCPEDVRTRGL